MSSLIPYLRDREDTRVVNVEKIGEKSQRFFNHQLLARFILFEHKVSGKSNSSSKYSSCIEIVAYASYVGQETNQVIFICIFLSI
jgi:hypothetical protein